MAGMQGGLSTRIGEALRHAGWHLTQQNASQRLVLLDTLQRLKYEDCAG